MTREERHIAVLSRLLENMNIFDSIQPTEERKKAIKAAIQALSQEPNRDMEEIAEIMKSDADTETKCKMISYILTAKPHYFEEQEPCDNAVSREAVMNEVKCWIDSGECRYTNATDYLSKRIRELPPVTQKSGKWIPISERLPKPYEQVLRTVKSFGWNSDFHVHVDIASICPVDTDVLAWMPLPKPYEPQERSK